MLFCSQEFLVFFLAVFTVYWAIPWPRVRIWLLLAASFYFYASWNHWLAILICLSSTADYTLARWMDSTSHAWRRKLCLLLSVGGNLGLLVYFKYVNFFLGSLEQTLHAAGASVSFPVLQVILPVGISFYTFEAISYSVDVYQRRLRAERSLASFMLFILFFPHLVAGPIVRGRDFLPQTHRIKRWNWSRLNLGVQLLLLGLFKKMAIADRLALYSDPVFANPAQYSAWASWIAVIAYAGQVYCDFSGYSDIALGTAHMLGYKLTRNFQAPYLAPNIRDFWRRWHISLSSWLRDYVFFPLGGSRHSRGRTYGNLLVVMTLCGLWHGASWPFVVFGFVQGVWLILHDVYRRWIDRRTTLSWLLGTPVGTGVCIVLTFTAFACSLVIFRSQSLEAAGTMYIQMLTSSTGSAPPLSLRGFVLLLSLLVIAHVGAHVKLWPWLLARLPAPVMGSAYAVVLTGALLLALDGATAFIYFQF